MALSIEEFGKQLLETGDLDPVYIALNGMSWHDSGQLKRWLLSYWCYYNCGVASYLSEFKGREYWEMSLRAAENIEAPPVGDRWPRGKERRHFRGAAAVTAVQALAARYPSGPEGFVEACAQDEPPHTLRQVSKIVQRHPQFGPWIGFKVADMLERVAGLPISFTDGEVMMFKDPTQAALMVYDKWMSEWLVGARKEVPSLEGKDRIIYVAKELGEHFKSQWAPPRYDRSVNIQEVETILCKWKSHCHGHYPVGNDIHEVKEGATPWAKVSPTAQRFVDNLPHHVHLG